jgi:hypothetical protein
VCIAKAYANCTTDPVLGVAQGREDFWYAVHEKFKLLLNEPDANLPHDYDWKEWTWQSVRDKFQKKIAKLTSKFNGFLKMVHDKDESGKTYEDKFNDALNMYFDAVGKHFPYKDCHEVLQTVPQYNFQRGTKADNALEIDDAEDEEEETGHNEIAGAQGGNIKRPIGSKKAKKEQFMRKMKAKGKFKGTSLDTATRTTGDAIDGLVAASNNLNDIMARSTNLQARKQRFSELKEMLKMSVAMEDDEQIAFYKKEIKEHMEQAKKQDEEAQKPQKKKDVPSTIDIEEEEEEV